MTEPSITNLTGCMRAVGWNWDHRSSDQSALLDEGMRCIGELDRLTAGSRDWHWTLRLPTDEEWSAYAIWLAGDCAKHGDAMWHLLVSALLLRFFRRREGWVVGLGSAGVLQILRKGQMVSEVRDTPKNWMTRLCWEERGSSSRGRVNRIAALQSAVVHAMRLALPDAIAERPDLFKDPGVVDLEQLERTKAALEAL